VLSGGSGTRLARAGRSGATQRRRAALRFFRNSHQSGSPEATGYKGFYYHFLDSDTGARVWRSELSMIDTALLIAGALTGSMYFGANTPDEIELRKLVDMLFGRIDRKWAQAGGATLSRWHRRAKAAAITATSRGKRRLDFPAAT